MARRSRRPADQPQRRPRQTPTTRPTQHPQKPDQPRHPDPETSLRASLENKKGFGLHPLFSFVDHGAAGPANRCRCCCAPGNDGSNTATDHITVIKAALAQLPTHRRGHRAGRKILIRTDSAGCTHKVLTWMSGQRLSYSVGFPLPHNTSDLLELIPAGMWSPA
jgi:hypothetical protein